MPKTSDLIRALEWAEDQMANATPQRRKELEAALEELRLAFRGLCLQFHLKTSEALYLGFELSHGIAERTAAYISNEPHTVVRNYVGEIDDYIKKVINKKNGDSKKGKYDA